MRSTPGIDSDPAIFFPDSGHPLPLSEHWAMGIVDGLVHPISQEEAVLRLPQSGFATRVR